MGNTRDQMMKNFSKENFEKMGKMAAVMKYKIIKRAVPLLKPNGLNATFIPINKDIALPESEVIPIKLLFDIIEKASYRVIVDFCPCRTAMDCKNHPHDIGCLMMGQGARDIDKTMGHEATVEEAKSHAERAINSGLVPLVGKSLVENMVFGISKPNKDKFFVACFCCHCCCLSRFLKPMSAELRNENLIKMKGLEIRVDDNCVGCGKCAEQCFISGVEIKDHKAVINDNCLGCGRCVSNCPNKALKISLTENGYVEEAKERFSRYVDIT